MINQRSLLGLCLAFVATASFSLTGCGGVECGDGTTEVDGECVLEAELPQCEEGQVIKDGECVAEVSCGANTTEDGDQCVADDPVSCDEPNTELDPNDNTCYATDAVCGDNTAFSASEDRCVPTADVCDDGTFFDDASGLCFPALECAPGDVVVDDVCVSFGEFLYANADVVADDDTNPDFEGTPAALPVAAKGEQTVFAGTIEAPSDLTDDGEANQHLDYFSFEGNAGDWFEISVYSAGIPSPLFMVMNDSFERLSPYAISRDKSRQVVLPEDGQYWILVAPEALFGGESGLIGSDDWNYAGTLELLDTPAPGTHDEGLFAGTLGALSDNFIAVDDFEAGATVNLIWDVVPAGAEPVVSAWASPTELIDEAIFDDLRITVPASGEFFVLADWLVAWSTEGLDFEIRIEERQPIATATFTLETFESVQISQIDGSQTIEVMVTNDDSGEVVADTTLGTFGRVEIKLPGEGDYTVNAFYDQDPDLEVEFDFEIIAPEVQTTFTAEPGDIVTVTRTDTQFATPEVLITEDDTGELLFSGTMVRGEQKFFFDLDGDYTVWAFRMGFNTDASVFEFEASAGDPAEGMTEVDVITATDGDVIEIRHNPGSEATDILVMGPGVIDVHSLAASGGDSVYRFHGTVDGDYTIYRDPDAENADLDIELITPEEVDFAQTYDVSGFEANVADQNYFMVREDQDTTVELTIDSTSGATSGGVRIIIYQDNEQLDRTDEAWGTTLVRDTTFTFEADTTYVIRVGNDWGFGETNAYDAVLSFDVQ